jgi:hypothetical protein
VNTPNDDIEALLETMIVQQRAKVLAIARERCPGATLEDLRNPQDLPDLDDDSRFHFEDGMLSGLISAQFAIRNRRRGRR